MLSIRTLTAPSGKWFPSLQCQDSNPKPGPTGHVVIENPSITRRTGLKLLTAAVTGGAATTYTVTRATRPAVAVSQPDGSTFEATDTATVEHNDGQVSAVTVAPDIAIEWRNFGSGVSKIELTLAASTGNGMDVLAQLPIESTNELDNSPVTVDDGSLENVSDQLVLSVDPHDITEIGDTVTTAEFSNADLQAGETATTTVELILGVDVYGTEGEHVEVVETATFDVTVKNPDGTGAIDATANANAN